MSSSVGAFTEEAEDPDEDVDGGGGVTDLDRQDPLSE